MSDQSVYGIKVKDSDASEAQVEVKVVAEPKVELLSNESNITVSEGKSLNVKWKITGESLTQPFTHYQMTNFRLFQIERLCRRQFQI